jgi:diguanylate cyclase (GGDEF)-like protein
LRDVTAQKRAHERLLHNAIHDSLTGLPNRELFLDRVHCGIARAHVDGSKPTVLYIDIDTFQSLSRNADFAVSDSMLLTISRRLARHLGPQDTLARIGSEQFGVLLSAETEPRHIAMLAERVRRSLRAPMKIAGRDVVLTGSIGISVYDGQQATPADLLREAETAMYRAKRSGADRIELYKPEMRGERSEREVIESELKQAIEKRQIRVLYQPIMRLGDEQLAGFAAQVRWQHPKLGALSTAEFLPIAEETGQISELSSYVMERAVRQVARWHRTLPRSEDPLFVGINVSSRHLFKQELVQDLRLIIGRESVPRGCLRLEVTESLVMENPEQAIEILDWLKGLGAGIALDEFGVGYSSLSYLHRLSVDTIKIDRSLISHGSDNKSGAVVLRAALAMARELGKDVVAVGIEREEDVAYVRALGCDYAQGFFFGEPMTEREVMSLLNALAKSNKRELKREKKVKKPEPELEAPQAELAPPDAEPDILREADELPPAPFVPPVQPQQPAPVKPSLPVPVARAKAEPLRKKAGLFAIFARKPAAAGKMAAKASGFSTMLSGIFSSSKKTRAKPEKPPVPRTARMANGRDPGGLRPPRPAPQEPKPADQQPYSEPPAFLQRPQSPPPPPQMAATAAGGSDPAANFDQREMRRERRRQS